jgi:hypothetical protein
MRTPSLFRGKIHCVHCSGKFKKRNNRNNPVYICSKVDNYGTCKRVTIPENKLLEIIQNRYSEELTKEELADKVIRIDIEDELLFTIELVDQDPIIYGRNRIIF